ncbi:MAG: hypothetical protein HYS27_23810 [Deltaproteobacteria bacterium]|nr:hypothetical protein [Deltaproteobacteria bacterium]
MTARLELHRDYQDMLEALARTGAEFVVLGGHAVAAHGFVRATKDLDILVRPSRENGERVVLALARYGAPLLGVTADDFAAEGLVFQVGVAPRRIDLLTAATGLSFDEALAGHLEVQSGTVSIPIVSLHALLKNKRATDRPEDRRDVRELEKLHGLAQAPRAPKRRAKASAKPPRRPSPPSRRR